MNFSTKGYITPHWSVVTPKPLRAQ
ncbi:hypothetical protein NPIL_572241, partial [Nephila pilipes]